MFLGSTPRNINLQKKIHVGLTGILVLLLESHLLIINKFYKRT